MTPTELQEILRGNEKLSIKQVKEAIKYLHDMAEENYKVETLASLKKYHSGQVNAFYICLDLLEKVGEDEIKSN